MAPPARTPHDCSGIGMTPLGASRLEPVSLPAPPPGTRRVDLPACRGFVTDATGYVPNVIKTSKYTVANFIPKNTFEQMHKAANAYFLGMGVIMLLGDYTPLFVGTIKAYSTLLTLAMMMTVTAVMAGLDDYRRHVADRATNGQLTVVADASATGMRSQQWSEVKVGDVLIVRNEQEFPADMVLLACSGLEGTCYVSTANLDGETNLKVKSAPSGSQEKLCGRQLAASASRPSLEPRPLAESRPSVLGASLMQQALEELKSFQGCVYAEPPTRSIHSFNGNLEVANKRSSGSSYVGQEPGQAGSGVREPLGVRQLLLRGTVLRNTAWCMGVVVYTGTETRMAMNSRNVPTKQSNLERVMNLTMLVVVFVQAVLAALGDVLFLRSRDHLCMAWYLHLPCGDRSGPLPEWISSWLTFFVLYSNLMPISIYATMEACNTGQAYFIKNDIGMCDVEQQCPAAARTTNLCQEIGQVSYIFSDKTGTLTQNIMELKQVAVAGATFGSMGFHKGFNGGDDMAAARRRDERMAAHIDNFLEVLAVSHTVVTRWEEDGVGRCYEAESPDEQALVEAAGELGWVFSGRTGQELVVEVKDSRGGVSVRKYTILALNAFTSARKRMSLVAQRDTGELLLLTKGADSAMLSRCNGATDAVQSDLDQFAREGLRTLVIGRREISREEFEPWQAEYEQAQRALTGREEALALVAEKIERRMDIAGITAIEDKLQVGVAETIVRLRRAGCKLWVLTGDKLETARNIGFSCRVLSEEMEILVLDFEQGQTQEDLESRLQQMESQVKSFGFGRVPAMMITGLALEKVTDGGLERALLDVAVCCSVVIACRVSPSQKAQLVRLVRTGVQPSPVTLAVGDGANDVPMIQEAQVGVGISGREGRQAVNASDFAIAQFRYLQRLLLVHGRWNYLRACKFILYTFWRNAVLVLMMFYYTLLSGSSGTSLFEDKLRMSFNVVLALPITLTGIFDRDVDAQVALQHPELYTRGRLGLDLNASKMVQTLFSAFVHSALVFQMFFIITPESEIGDYYSFGTAIFTVMIIGMNCRAGFITTTWNWVIVAGLVGSMFMYIFYLFVYASMLDLSLGMYQVPHIMIGNRGFWFCVIAIPLEATMIDLFVAYVWLTFWPEERDRVLEQEEQRRQRSSSPRSETLCTDLEITSHLAHVPEDRPSARGKGLVADLSPSHVTTTLASGASAALSREASQSHSWPAVEAGSTGSHRRTFSAADFSFPDNQPARSHRSLMVSAANDFAHDTSLLKSLPPPPAPRRSSILGPDERRSEPLLARMSLASQPSGFASLRGPTSASSSSTAGLTRRPSQAGALATITSDAANDLASLVSTSPFAQQALKSVQLPLHHGCMLYTALGSCITLATLGVAALYTSRNAQQVRVVYAGSTPNSGHPFGTLVGEVIDRTDCGSRCDVNITIPADMMAHPIHVDYFISPFYQSHYWYLRSVLDNELMGRAVTTGDRNAKCKCDEKELAPFCKAPSGKDYVPCGLQAAALFNDTFELKAVDGRRPGPGEAFNSTNIAWPTDVQRRYKEAFGYSSNRTDKVWLKDRFSFLNNSNFSGSGTGSGMLNEHFAVWMRPDPSNYASKAWGRLELNSAVRARTITLTVHIEALYDVSAFDGTKMLVLHNGSPFGGRNDLPGACFVVGAGVCLGMALAILVMQRWCRRTREETSSGHWVHQDHRTLEVRRWP